MTIDLFLDHRLIENLADPEAVKAVAFDPKNSNPDPINQLPPDWGDLSLASGYPGLILFFSQLEKIGLVDGGAIAHRYVLKIKEAIEKNGLSSLSLFGGVTGICFALQQASCGGTRYQRMLQSLHSFIVDQIEPMYLAPLRENRFKFLPSSPALYDPIQGICGVGRYLVEHLTLPHFEKGAKDITSVLVQMCHPFLYDGVRIPGWYLSPEDTLNARNRAHNPKGNFNLGLAHGVTGILAFLSIALLKGVEVEGQKEAIEIIVQWIREQALMTPKGITWPYSVSWEEEVADFQNLQKGSRDAWCYGAPGIARTLFLAGKAIGNEELKNFAGIAFHDIFLRSQEEWYLPGPTLCHGIAGLLLITNAMAKEKELSDLKPKVEELKKLLFSFYRANTRWGFSDVELCRNKSFCEVEKAGFLEGATGVILTLLTLETSDTQWALPLLIHE